MTKEEFISSVVQVRTVAVEYERVTVNDAEIEQYAEQMWQDNEDLLRQADAQMTDDFLLGLKLATAASMHR
jgi:hypothetical protein